jgi:hypothetical protein
MRYKLQVREALKGEIDGGQVEFVIPQVYEPALGLRATPKIEVGQEWLVFLQASERGLYPFAWRNSLLRIQEDSLIYNSHVTYPWTRSETVRHIRDEVRSEEE